MATNTTAVCCVNCGGTTVFDPTLGKLKCEFCDSVFTQEEAEAFFKEKEAHDQAKESGSDWGADADDMKSLSCSTCGAAMLAEENTAATICPYCGNSTVVESQFSGAVKPDFLIPFAFTKEQAMEKYKAYYQKRKLLPKSFLEGNKVEEIQGVYVPFWLYDGTVSITAEYEAVDRQETETEIIKKIYKAERRGSIAFQNVPADASARMPDDIMDSIEPFKFDALKPFSMTYLPGFLAERFDVTGDDDLERAEKRVKETTRQKTRDTVKHDSIEKTVKEDCKVNYTDKKYAMLPVWYLTTRWQDKQWNFAMNGQTGQFTGDLPVDKGKLALLVAIFVLVPLLAVGLLAKNWLVAVIVGAIVGLIAGLVAYSSMKPVHNATQANAYMDDQVKLVLTRDTFQRTEREKKEQKNQQ